ncbi:hypothetical protein [Sphaerisporangium flaviroseum]
MQLDFETYPKHGHMLVVAPTFDAVFWLADRHAAFDRPGNDATVILQGEGRVLLEARAQSGIITFREAICHDGPNILSGTLAAKAYATLHDSHVIASVLFSPYIADILARPSAPHLRDPDGLIWRDAIALHAKHRLLLWVCQGLGGTVAFTAPILDTGAVDWGSTVPQVELLSSVRNDVRRLSRRISLK